MNPLHDRRKASQHALIDSLGTILVPAKGKRSLRVIAAPSVDVDAFERMAELRGQQAAGADPHAIPPVQRLARDAADTVYWIRTSLGADAWRAHAMVLDGASRAATELRIGRRTPSPALAWLIVLAILVVDTAAASAALNIIFAGNTWLMLAMAVALGTLLAVSGHLLGPVAGRLGRGALPAAGFVLFISVLAYGLTASMARAGENRIDRLGEAARRSQEAALLDPSQVAPAQDATRALVDLQNSVAAWETWLFATIIAFSFAASLLLAVITSTHDHSATIHLDRRLQRHRLRSWHRSIRIRVELLRTWTATDAVVAALAPLYASAWIRGYTHAASGDQADALTMTLTENPALGAVKAPAETDWTIDFNTAIDDLMRAFTTLALPLDPGSPIDLLNPQVSLVGPRMTTEHQHERQQLSTVDDGSGKDHLVAGSEAA